MDKYNEKSKENISKICSLVNQSISKSNKTKFNKNVWLKEINVQVIHLFNIINKSFINGTSNDEGFGNLNQKQVTETCLVYGDQILKCLNQFKNIFAYERKHNVKLKSSTQFLADRMLLSVEKIKSLSALSTKNSRYIDKLLDNLDEVFSFLKLLQVKSRGDLTDKLDSFNTTTGELISQSWEFACFLEDNDKMIVKNICTNILNNHKALMDEFSISTESDKLDGLTGSIKFNFDLLYNSVLSLEVNLNDCFLRLIYTTFSYLETTPLKTIINERIQEEMDKFDLANERLIQIGVYAAYHTTDLKVKSKILSGLLTMESLDAYLIPTIMADSDELRNFLVSTWKSTAKSLKYYIHSVIDTVPFLNGIDGIIMNFLKIPKNSLTANDVDNIILKLKVILNHFETNKDDFEDAEIRQHIDNFKLIVREVVAINVCFEKVDRSKIIKRIKITKSILKKACTAIESCSQDQYNDTENTNNTTNSKIGRDTMKSKQMGSTFVKQTDNSTFDIDISNILNEFLMLSNEI